MLTGACQIEHGGLVVLTSRFPFADLDAFDGGSARMLELPSFTPAEGAALLGNTGGGWLPDQQRQELVAAVDGHALAVTVLAGLLAARLPAAGLDALREDLATAARTDARVGKVLGFYAAGLAEADRYLLAAVSLFTRPVTAEAVLAVAAHEAFGALAGWTPGMVQAAVRDRLAGLATWYPDGTISTHPLVRDTFRPLALQAAATAADTTLTGLPEGRVTSRADALRVTEAIELLLDAGQWQRADNLYRARCASGDVWKHLACGATRAAYRHRVRGHSRPPRRLCHSPRPPPPRLLPERAGLFATRAGDLVTARDYLTLAVRYCRDAEDMHSLGAVLLNLAECLGRLGLAGPAREAAAEALICAESADHRAMSGVRMRFGVAGGPRPATPQPPSSTSPPPTRSASPMTRRRSPVLAARGLVGAVVGPDRASRPRPGPDPPQRRIMPRVRLERQTWPGVTRYWAAWPWPPETPPLPGRT